MVSLFISFFRICDPGGIFDIFSCFVPAITTGHGKQMRRIRHILCCWACLICHKLFNCNGLDVVLMAISSLENNLTDVQYGHNKARWFLPFSVDNKLRYCHFNHLSCVFGGDFQKKEKDDRFKLSSRFAKRYWIHLQEQERNKGANPRELPI